MESRNKRNHELIYPIVLPLIIVLFGINICFINLNLNLKEKINTYNHKLDSIQNNYNSINKKINLLETEMYKYTHIDVEKAKQEYYKTLKVFEDKVANKEINYKIAYLTFDDGPYYLTHQYLDVLEKYDVRATFFTIGLDKEYCYDNRSQECGSLYAKEASYGHTMANHTYSHLIFNGLYSSIDSFIAQVDKQEQLIKEKTGITTNIVRFPGGFATAKNLGPSIANKLREKGYGWVDWSSLNGDGGYVPNATVALNNFKNTIDEDIEVVLFHDYSYITLSILPEAIEYLKSQNYVLLPLFYESRMINK